MKAKGTACCNGTIAVCGAPPGCLGEASCGCRTADMASSGHLGRSTAWPGRMASGSSAHSVTIFAGDALIGSHLVSETTRALAGTNPTVDQLRQQFAAP